MITEVFLGLLAWFCICQWFTNRSHRRRIEELEKDLLKPPRPPR
jgi:hypothetical protein